MQIKIYQINTERDIGMKGNRRLNNGHSIIAGPFFVVGLTSDDFRSLRHGVLVQK